ncbi:hypothetical protein SK128_015357 [Halocaridina rubra]|uniref:Uncharacterized protein n=1 Tax=Halocaridina rubra TaxID=373956 RepID=A0AAN8XS35_HALRR
MYYGVSLEMTNGLGNVFSQGLVDTGWAAYPPPGYPPTYLGSSLPACPTTHPHHGHPHLATNLPPAAQRDLGIAEAAAAAAAAAASSSHLNFLSDHLGGGDATGLSIPKELLGGPHSGIPSSVSVATTLSMLGGGAVFGGNAGSATSLLGGCHTVHGGDVGSGNDAGIAHGASVAGGGSSVLGGGAGVLGVGPNFAGGGPGVYLTPPMLPAASLLYSSLCSVLPHTPTTATPPTNTPPTREDVTRPSNSAISQGLSQPLPHPTAGLISSSSNPPNNLPRPPDPVWRPY